MTKPRLMIIGGTWEQVPLIKKAKEMGCYVLVTSPSKVDDGLNFADETAIVEPRNLAQILHIAQQFKPDGITADECDYSHYAAVVISEHLGLAHDGLHAAQLTTNKLWMRQACHTAHILQPRFMSCKTMHDARQAIKIIGWPVIVKPVDNRGAFGINIATTDAELANAYLDALMNAHSREVIIEAYIEGIHITVDGCVNQQGEHHNLAIASKSIIDGNKPIIVEVNYPAHISDEYVQHIYQVNQRVIEALGICAGLTHSEYILDAKGRCFLVETANRGGGVYTSAKIVPAMSNVDLSQLLICNALKQPFTVKKQPYHGQIILKFFVFNAGTVKAINGLEQALTFKGVQLIKLLIQQGDTLAPPKSGAERHGFVILQAENKAAIEALYQSILSTITIDYETD